MIDILTNLAIAVIVIVFVFLTLGLVLDIAQFFLNVFQDNDL